MCVRNEFGTKKPGLVLVPTIIILGGVPHYYGTNIHKFEIFLIAPRTAGFGTGFKGKREKPWIID
jgi:hypothetical protein